MDQSSPGGRYVRLSAFTVVVAIGAGVWLISQLAAFVLPGDAGETVPILGSLLFGVTFAPWVARAKANTRAFTATRGRFSPAMAAICIFIPLVNIFTVGVILEEIWTLSAPTPQPRWSLIRVFARVVIYVLFLGRAILMLVATLLFMGGGNDLALKVLPILQPISILLLLGGLSVPFLGMAILIKIGKAQDDSWRRMRAIAV